MSALLGLLGYQVFLFLFVVLSRPETLERFRRLDKVALEDELRVILMGDSSNMRVDWDLWQTFSRYGLLVVRRRFPIVYCMPHFFELDSLVHWMFGRWVVYLALLVGGPGVILGLLVQRVPLLYRLDLSPEPVSP